MSPADHTPAWLEWLKKPENLMTGIVLAAGLMQDKRPGQSNLDAFGQRALGALAFRGGLDLGVQEAGRRDRELASQQQYRQGRLDLGKEQIRATREEGAATRKHAGEQTDKTIQGQKDLRAIPQAQTPAETDYTKALAEQARAQAGLYGRMPAIGKGSGSGPDDALGGDLYEQEMFKSWFAAEQQNALQTGKPFVMDPMKWAIYIQPYRNAKLQLRAMEAQGLPGEVYQNDKGQWFVRVAGVATPQAGPPGEESPNPPPVELAPGIEGAVAAATQRKAEEAQVAAAAAEAARPATPEEMKPFMDKLQVLSYTELVDLLRAKSTPKEQLRIIRAELHRRLPARAKR